MMSQLMGKEILYEPLKELHEKVDKIIMGTRSHANAMSCLSSLRI